MAHRYIHEDHPRVKRERVSVIVRKRGAVYCTVACFKLSEPRADADLTPQRTSCDPAPAWHQAQRSGDHGRAERLWPVTVVEARQQPTLAGRLRPLAGELEHPRRLSRREDSRLLSVTTGPGTAPT